MEAAQIILLIVNFIMTALMLGIIINDHFID